MLSEVVSPVANPPSQVTIVEVTKDRIVTDAVPLTDPAAGATVNVREIPDRAVKDVVKVLKLLSDETRLRIVFYLLQRGELHVRALCDILGQTQPAVSHHLGLLRVAGIVQCRRQGKHNFYRILPAPFQQLLAVMLDQLPPNQRQVWLVEPRLSAAATTG